MTAREFFETLEAKAEPDRIVGIEHTYVFAIEGEGRWLVTIGGGNVTVVESADGIGDVVVTTSSETFARLAGRELNPMIAYMNGKLRIDGDLDAALKLKALF